MRRANRISLIAGLGIAVLFSTASIVAASVQTYGFTHISNNSGVAEDLALQLCVDVWDKEQAELEFGIDLGDAGVLFVFKNMIGIDSSITDVYFDDGNLLGLNQVFNSLGASGVDFSAGAAPPDLPGGGSIDPEFEATAGFTADSNPPASANGVDAIDELLGISFTLILGTTYSDILDALAAGLALQPGDDPVDTLRIGLHVQSIDPSGNSDAFINGDVKGPVGPPPPAVPEPVSIAIWSLLVGIAALLVSPARSR